MRDYPNLLDDTLGGHSVWMRKVTQMRSEDISDYNNLQNNFLSGRSTNRIPTGSTNVINGDKVGDVAIDSNYMYRLIQTGPTTAEWRRVALGSW